MIARGGRLGKLAGRVGRALHLDNVGKSVKAKRCSLRIADYAETR
jgi:hypothetical protein